MHQVKLVVRVSNSGRTVGGYVRQLSLPFIPQRGMKFEQGVSCGLWETERGGELSPEVEQVIYDINSEEVVCLFTVSDKLVSTFWTELKVAELGSQCAELIYFRDERGAK